MIKVMDWYLLYARASGGDEQGLIGQLPTQPPEKLASAEVAI
jgi:hypothetical protein